MRIANDMYHVRTTNVRTYLRLQHYVSALRCRDKNGGCMMGDYSICSCRLLSQPMTHLFCHCFGPPDVNVNGCIATF